MKNYSRTPSGFLASAAIQKPMRPIQTDFVSWNVRIQNNFAYKYGRKSANFIGGSKSSSKPNFARHKYPTPKNMTSDNYRT